MIDRTKFVERPGDSEGFTGLMLDQQSKGDALRAAYVDPDFEYNEKTMSYHRKNPKGWQEVDGVKLPPITWADRTPLERAKALHEASDEALEEVFQAWLRTSTRPKNLAEYRARLRDRINEMVARAQQ